MLSTLMYSLIEVAISYYMVMGADLDADKQLDIIKGSPISIHRDDVIHGVIK